MKKKNKLGSIFTACAVVSLVAVLCSCRKDAPLRIADSSSVKSGQSTDTSKMTSSASYDARKVSINDLPGSSEAFIKQHYPAYKIITATYDPLCGGAAAIDVAIRSKGKPNYSLIFLPNGSFVQQEQDVLLSSAPSIVIENVKKEYPGFVIAKQIEYLTMADGSIQYEFDLSKGPDKREVIVSSAGIVICEGKD